MISHIFMLLALSGATAQCPSSRLALREYTVDYGHSIVEFSIRFAFSRVKGRFAGGKGTILYDEANPANSSVTVVLESKSIDTGWGNRDRHLRSSDFFDVEKYPSIEFQSRRLMQTTDGWIAEGDLTMRGVTKRIRIPFEFLQPPARSAESRWMVMNLRGGVRLARADFAINGGSTHNSWFNNARAATMGDSVEVSFEVEGYSPDAASQRSAGVESWLDSIRTKGVPSQIARLAELKRTKSAPEFAPYFRGADRIVRGLIGSCRLPDAAAFSQAITELFPDSHSARLINGFVLDVSGDRRAATAEYTKAKGLFRAPVNDPDEPFPQDNEDWWYMDQLARTALEWGYLEQAIPLARVLTELYPQTARAFTTYGQTLARSGDTNAAAAAYARALQVDPHETRALEWRRRS